MCTQKIRGTIFSQINQLKMDRKKQYTLASKLAYGGGYKSCRSTSMSGPSHGSPPIATIKRSESLRTTTGAAVKRNLSSGWTSQYRRMYTCWKKPEFMSFQRRVGGKKALRIRYGRRRKGAAVTFLATFRNLYIEFRTNDFWTELLKCIKRWKSPVAVSKLDATLTNGCLFSFGAISWIYRLFGFVIQFRFQVC